MWSLEEAFAKLIFGSKSLKLIKSILLLRAAKEKKIRFYLHKDESKSVTLSS